jgi:two-component system sensor kinase FixL
MHPNEIGLRFAKLREYIQFTTEDEARIRSLAELVGSHTDALVDDFYAEISRHQETSRAITGGAEQIARLKTTLAVWLREMLLGPFDDDYAMRRWRVGRRHVEIALPQIFVNAAHARLRARIQEVVVASKLIEPGQLSPVLVSLHKALDLDLAMIQDAYEQQLVAQRKELERRRSDAVFRKLVETADVCIVLVRDDGVIAFVNSYIERALGWKHGELESRCAVDWLCTPADQAAFQTSIRLAASGTEVKGLHARMLGADGIEREMLWNLCAMEHHDLGAVTLAVGQDITSVLEAQKKALQAERLALIGRMSAGLAHEARNALQRIQACSEMLEMEIGNNSEAITLVGRIQTAQDQMHRLFDEVRGYAGDIRLDIAPCSVREVWREAWESLAVARRGRDAVLIESTDASRITLPIDRYRLVQVFRILFENALAAADPVEITVGCQWNNPAKPCGLRIWVRDNGPGLTPEQRKRIFEPFYTTKPKGTGLGMSIAQRIVEAHGGSISVGEPASEGAEIQISLPAEEAG